MIAELAAFAFGAFVVDALVSSPSSSTTTPGRSYRGRLRTALRVKRHGAPWAWSAGELAGTEASASLALQSVLRELVPQASSDEAIELEALDDSGELGELQANDQIPTSTAIGSLEVSRAENGWRWRAELAGVIAEGNARSRGAALLAGLDAWRKQGAIA